MRYKINDNLYDLYKKLRIEDYSFGLGGLCCGINFNHWKDDKSLDFKQWRISYNEDLTHNNLLKYLYSKMPNLYIFDPAKSIEDFTKLNIDDIIHLKEVIKEFYTIYMVKYKTDHYRDPEEIIKLKKTIYNTFQEFKDYYDSVKHYGFPLFDGITEQEDKLFELLGLVDQYESCYNQYKKALNDFIEECNKYSDQLDRLIASSKKSIPTYQSRAADLMQYAKTL